MVWRSGRTAIANKRINELVTAGETFIGKSIPNQGLEIIVIEK